MIDKEKFLTSYNIEPEELKAAGLDWEELAAIYDDYLSVEGKLRSIGKDFVYDYLYDIEGQASIPTGTALRIPAI